MANPKRKQSRHRTMSRRDKCWNLTTIGSSGCSNCGGTRPGHTVCPHCGFYDGKLVIAKKAKKTKKTETEPPQEES